jgi:hypothetical protein
MSADPLPPPIYDEAQVPAYTLPAALVTQAGSQVSTPVQWRNERRPELLKLFATHVYGQMPGKPTELTFRVGPSVAILDGKATRKEVVIDLGAAAPAIHLLVYLPKRDGKVPVFVGLNFLGNQSVDPDPRIPLTANWVSNDKQLGITNNRTNDQTRGKQAARWQIPLVLERGYGLATAYYGDIDPDFDDGFKNGVHPLFPRRGTGDDWGAIGAWAWGLSRALDYLETDPQVDAKRVAVIGHSRLGKTALWAGACDERFSIVISNNSGCGGAALSKRIYGETVGSITRAFPHWFCANFKPYAQNEAQLPVDQHQLIALIAPRPVYVASATADKWADPKGEYLGLYHALPVYQLLGTPAQLPAEMPAPDEPIQNAVGYHLRTGAHDVTAYDWQQYLAFAERHWKP